MIFEMRSLRRGLAAAGVAAVALAACSLELPGQGDPPRQFVLTPKSTYDDDVPTVEWQLLVDKPVAKAGLDTSRIALRHSAIQFDYYSDAAWMDTAPGMVQALLVESFENSGRIVGVSRFAIGVKSDFVLTTELRHFWAEYQGPKPVVGPNARRQNKEAPKVRVSVIAKLIQMPRRDIVASERFDALVQANGPEMLSIVSAFDEAIGKVMKRLVTWTLEQGKLNTTS